MRATASNARLIAEELMSFIDASPTAFQAVAETEKRLKKAGFKEASLKTMATAKCPKKGYYKKNNSAIMAFVLGDKAVEKGLRVFGAHSDSPALKIKPQSVSVNEGVVRLTTEVYGGPILNTWFDRPLSLAGRAFIRGKDPLHPQEVLVDFQKPILILPNVAIHMNRDVNDGVKIERQKVLLPFLALTDEKDQGDFLLNLLAKQLKKKKEEILSYDLFCYDVQKANFCGVDDCFISVGRQDNLSSVFAGLCGLISAAQDKAVEGLAVLLVTDNEEVGSHSRQGAQSAFPFEVLEALVQGLGGTAADLYDLYDRSFMVSCDLAHAVHPNYAEYADPTHRPRLNKGPVIKVAASGAYASDALSTAMFKELCRKSEVPYQFFVNRSDLRGGSTIGPISSVAMPMPTVDIGGPLWGMHSVRETGGAEDPWMMERLADSLFRS